MIIYKGIINKLITKLSASAITIIQLLILILEKKDVIYMTFKKDNIIKS